MKLLFKNMHSGVYVLSLLWSSLLLADVASGNHFVKQSGCAKLERKIRCLEKKIDELINKPDCDNAIVFGSEEINQAGGYIIKAPGHYCLKEDVNFLTTLAGSQAIQITSQDVTVNLSGFEITQANATANSVGIYVAPGLSSVQVVNGRLTGFTNRGIWYDSSTNIITLDNLVIEKCGTAIHLGPNVASNDPSQIGTYVSEVQLTNSRLLRNAIGLVIHANQNILVENCEINESTPVGAVAAATIRGIGTPQTEQVGYAQNIRVENSTFNNTIGGMAGVLMISIDNLQVKGCQFNNNQLNAGLVAAGCARAGTVNAFFENCQANNNTWILGIIGAVSVSASGSGYAVGDILNVVGGNGRAQIRVATLLPPPSTGIATVTLVNGGAGYSVGANIATVAVLPSTGTGATININQLAIPAIFNGYHDSANLLGGLLRTDTPTFRNCEANENVAPCTVTGFQVSYKNNVLFENCRAAKNRSLTQTPNLITGRIPSIPMAAGFQFVGSVGVAGATDVHSGGNNCTFVNCVAQENIAEQGLGAGFVWLGGEFGSSTIIKQNASFVDCQALGNGGLADSPPIFFLGVNLPAALGIGAGIFVDRGIVANTDNYRLNTGLFPAAAYKNVAVTGCVLSGNNAGPTPAAGGQQYSGGLVFSGVDTATVKNNTAMGNTNGYVLTGGTTWNGLLITNTQNALIQDDQAVNHSQANGGNGFIDANVAIQNANAFVSNTAIKNTTNYAIGASANINNISVS